MKIWKEILLCFCAAAVTLVLVFLLLGYQHGIFADFIPKEQNPYQDSIILFYTDTCDHCATVNTFIKNNRVEEKMALVKLNISNNTTNTNLLSDKTQNCGLDFSQIGVPFLWDGPNQKCILGDIDIVDFLKEKIKNTSKKLTK